MVMNINLKNENKLRVHFEDGSYISIQATDFLRNNAYVHLHCKAVVFLSKYDVQVWDAGMKNKTIVKGYKSMKKEKA